MRRSVFYTIQAVWSLLLSSIVWYLFLTNTTFDFYHISDSKFAGIILFSGLAVYLVLTVIQTVIGVKKIKGWRWWDILLSLAFAGIMVFAGAFAVVYGTELF